MPKLVVSVNARSLLVESFLQECPEVAAALEAAGAYLVVFGPALAQEASDGRPTPEQVVEGFSLALDDGMPPLPPGTPLFVATCPASWLVSTLEARRKGRAVPGLALRPRSGRFAGFLGVGEGGGVFMTPDGREASSMGAAGELAMERLRDLLPGR